jgi:CheY-like chemotaxis protein
MAKKILILDDDEDILYFCTVIFEELKFEVKSVLHSNNILDQVADAQPDVILIDMRMPGPGGVVSTQQLKADKRFSSIPVVMFSATNDLQQVAQKAGADAYIQKPFDLDELEALILSLLHLKKQSG